MDIKYGSDEAKAFVTNLSFITSKGKWGYNVMTAEWVHQVSYSPGLVMVNVHDVDATSDNILESKEFGVSILTEEHTGFVRIAGGSSGKEYDKMAILKDIGAEFYKAKKIDVQMLKGAALNLELKLIKHEKVGDHMMLIGEVVEMSVNKDAKRIVFLPATGLYRIEKERVSAQMDDAKVEELTKKYKK